MPRATPAAERVVKRSVIDANGCWVYQGAMGGEGYGQVRVVIDGVPASDRANRYKTRETHRITWEAENGTVPPKHHLRHTCGNRACCNPDHLELRANRELAAA